MSPFSAIVALVLGTLMVVFSILSLIRNGRIRRWPRVEAKVVERDVVRSQAASAAGPPGFRWTPRIRFSYSWEGRTLTSDRLWPEERTSTHEWARRVIAGIPETALAFVNPANPEEAYLLPGVRGWLWVAAAVGAVMILFALTALAPAPISLEETRAWVGRELPPGTPQTRVAEVLDARGIGHSEFLKDSRMIFAKIKSPSFSFIERTILLEFQFDERANLVSASVREAFTGP